MRLFYNKQATIWEEALPLGNGSLGAMVFGGIKEDRIQFNEDTLWTGKPHDYTNKGAAKYLSEVRKLLLNHQQEEAEELVMKHMMSDPLRLKAFQPFADLWINYNDHDDVTEYSRELDLEQAKININYRIDDNYYRREVFASAVDDAIILRISCNEPVLNLGISLDCEHDFWEVTSKRDEINLTGQVEEEGLKFAATITCSLDRGKMIHKQSAIEIKDAGEVLIKLVAATSYVNYRDISADPLMRCQAKIDAIKNKEYKLLFEHHLSDYQSLFNRVELNLGKNESKECLPTDIRIKQYDFQDDPGLVSLLFQYGRYLLIASSRPGTQPANLQGIWNHLLNPPWESKWTTNINLEMNYWPAEVCNLSECHQPMFDLIDELVVTGSETAREHYDCRGWILHHNTDIWRATTPVDFASVGLWVGGAAWLCHHLWEHYQFTKDREFLVKKAYPVMKKAALFLLDYLIEDSKTGYLIIIPSNSPENGGLTAGPTMDHQLTRALFNYCIKGSEILQCDHDFRMELKETIERIAPNKIGRFGQLQEWLADKDDPEDHHRHVSHLWALYPGDAINPEDTPELFEASKVSLKHRGDGGTGWSLAWKINLWARLRDGDHANDLITQLLNLVSTSETNYMGGGGVYPNLFDAHPPFQIDGNFGVTAGIAEMLLQSHNGTLTLLPALPGKWEKGSIKGLKARNGYEVDIYWQEGKLDVCIIKASNPGICRLMYDNQLLEFKVKADEIYEMDSNLELR